MIYVDFQQACIPGPRWRWNTVSHLSCDPTADLEPLHQFAVRIGLKRRWFQPRGGIMPHYDLSPGMRQAALRAGATELETREAVVAVIQGWRLLKANKSPQPELL